MFWTRNFVCVTEVVVTGGLTILNLILYLHVDFSGSSPVDRPQGGCEDPKQTKDQES